jgi:hypothetical protein
MTTTMTTTEHAAARVTEARMEAHAAWEALQSAIGTPGPALSLACLDRLHDIDGHIFWAGMMVVDPQRAIDAVNEMGEVLVSRGRADTIPSVSALRAACAALAGTLHQTLADLPSADQVDVKLHLAEARRRYLAMLSATLWS